ncbi:prepilin peptidase [Phenylobacterium sp.]|uniref:A24 family peptidase n=1 Tax=Phenylobacterium sp. TaxID=1871053 RepID=UPI0025E7E845|nr:prepilin peptidase [Phenylobacterium sp.]
MIALLVTALVLCLPALLVTAAVSDIVTFTIPNWIALTLLALFPVAALAAGLPPLVIAQNFGVGVGLLAVGVAMFALRWAGGGDAKLLAAAGLWLGWDAMPTFLLSVAMTGGLLSLMLLTLRSEAVRPVAMLGPRWVNRLADPTEGIPYGVAIAVGACMALTASPFGAALRF